MPGNGKRIRDESIASAVENLRLSQEGVYHIDLDSLMKGNPLVFKVKEGIYRIDFSAFPRVR